MDRLLITLLFLFYSTECFSQPERPGLFKHINTNIKTGLTGTIFWKPGGEYYYILQKDSYLLERKRNHIGASLSFVLLFPLNKNLSENFVLNISFIDFKSDIQLFNSQTPFGIGYAHFFDKENMFGLTAMVNFGKQKKLDDYTLKNIPFPIDHYINADSTSLLRTGAPMPSAILDQYYVDIFSVSFNLGFVLRF